MKTKPVDPKTAELNRLQVEARKDFFEKPPRRSEVFRIFVSSDTYEVKQMAYSRKISIKQDKTADQEFSDEILKKYDVVDYKAKAIINIELYPDSGKLAKVHFTRPTGTSEMDTLISQDVTRLIFEFQKDNIEPISFKVTYLVLLRKRASKEEVQEILQKYAK